jgi:hypothetical protein
MPGVQKKSESLLRILGSQIMTILKKITDDRRKISDL